MSASSTTSTAPTARRWARPPTSPSTASVYHADASADSAARTRRAPPRSRSGAERVDRGAHRRVQLQRLVAALAVLSQYVPDLADAVGEGQADARPLQLARQLDQCPHRGHIDGADRLGVEDDGARAWLA